ncbi:MAG: transposase [Candidatus Methanoperedens sp.]|nr:RNA-guided endonuclease TnpB family protein [Candidatus Methanoperedens sp. BLZ2]KAB2943433.1 MAG: IS200/IS605 family element transposase accessory protein TnpB [Candidatus Methanoperedens sp.]MBZ0176457.1 transposase [Candidatus Methanoperedens nitroreducens]MCX9078650.1 transposase [Candidatus Methanoperedens sp.]
MLQTLMIKLDTSKEQHASLLETMHQFNEACNYIANIAFERKTANKMELQKIIYYEVRDKFKLSAQLTIRAIAKVSEAYKRNKTIKPEFKPIGAIVYDQRILSWRKLEAVSILTISGRQTIPIRIGEYQRVRLDRIRGQADLILRNDIFYLAVVVEVPEASKFDAVGTLGIDLGIVNLATDNDGESFSGKQIDTVREKNAVLKANLQKTGTKSSKRHLKKLSGRESRFHRDVNHVISRKIVAKAKDTKQAIALEDLKGIRKSVTVRRTQRSRIHSWAFFQLRSFIEYKAILVGVPVVLVNPRGTSHICPVCNHNERGNRPNRDNFKCVQCGFSGNADHIAAINIAARAVEVNQRIVAYNEVKANTGIETEHSYKPPISIVGN